MNNYGPTSSIFTLIQYRQQRKTHSIFSPKTLSQLEHKARIFTPIQNIREREWDRKSDKSCDGQKIYFYSPTAVRHQRGGDTTRNTVTISMFQCFQCSNYYLYHEIQNIYMYVHTKWIPSQSWHLLSKEAQPNLQVRSAGQVNIKLPINALRQTHRRKTHRITLAVRGDSAAFLLQLQVAAKRSPMHIYYICLHLKHWFSRLLPGAMKNNKIK